jgi:N-acyl-D-amino-acid deacylase
MSDILLRNGTLVDGTGAEPSRGDLLIRGDRIAAIGAFDRVRGAEEIDCSGLIIAPGFIDAHSHSDLQVLEGRREKILQGVTTEVVGNCGFSPYPAAGDRSALHQFANGIFCGDDSWGWERARDYLGSVAGSSAVVNVVSLVGHGTLRIAQAGNKLGPLPERDLEAMEKRLAEALEEGAAGFSTGLMYAPGESAPFEELERLCRVVATHDKIYTTHMRSYSAGLLLAVEEQLELARRTGCRLQISHMQAVGPAHWEKQQVALEKIEKAKSDGIDVAFDCYPYTAGSTVLTQLLPQSALEGGIDAMLARLSDPVQRKGIAAETVASIAQRWVDVFISAVESARNRGLVGHNLAGIAESRGCEPVDAMIDVLIEERGTVNMVSFNQSEDNLRQTLSHPLSNIISDGFYVKGRPHPRLHGTFPYMLGTICRERGWLGLPVAIHKMTGRPAQRFGLHDRGLLRPGYLADVTVFDPGQVNSPANYESPELAPVGIRYVFRNGKLEVGGDSGI